MQSYTPQTNGTPAVNGDYVVQGAHEPQEQKTIGASGSADPLYTVVCGPLLNYRRMSDIDTEQPIWHGSVLVLTDYPAQSSQPSTSGSEPQLSTPPPTLRLTYSGPVSPWADHAVDRSNVGSSAPQPLSVTGVRLYHDDSKLFWRFYIELPMLATEGMWEYAISGLKDTPEGNSSTVVRKFAVPARSQSMRIMFHSCNGFSVGTDVDAWSGPALWNDVLRMHAEKPFHVMIGGGDQIYNDSIRVDGPLRNWTAISNPHKRRTYPFDQEMRRKCDEYYFQNYVTWYSTKPFATANAQIPQINIWDDHDIIDGFGSYTDHFMRCPIFRGIGGVAHKYYLLFQHHLAPPRTSYTSEGKSILKGNVVDGGKEDTTKIDNIYIHTEGPEDDSYIIGSTPGPYMEECSRSMFCRLGERIAFVGIDARMERTRHQINYPETYDLIFNRLHNEFQSSPSIKHLILLLGVPIAYPRLIWLENILRSPIIGPIRFLNKRFGFAGGLFNQFDGAVDLLDDLDDHYTARQHKAERRQLVHRLQEVAHKHNVRVTILGGDVHLGAMGRFYSKTALAIPVEKDHRYMMNIISSAITNKPPPSAIANLLARRNKIHHLDQNTDETLLNFFDHDPGLSPNTQSTTVTGKPLPNGQPVESPGTKTRESNHATMPSRNYTIISEGHTDQPATGREPAPNAHATTASINGGPATDPGQSQPLTNGAHVEPGINGTRASEPLPAQQQGNPRHAMSEGERGAGTGHPAAVGFSPSGVAGPYALDVTMRVEISPRDPDGHTQGYGLSIPALEVEGTSASTPSRHHFRR